MHPRSASPKPDAPRIAFESERRTSIDPRLRGLLITGLGIVLCFSLTSEVEAESELLLDMPENLEDIAATTFDSHGRAIGLSWFEIESNQSGTRHMKIELSVDGGGTNRSEATLVPVSVLSTAALPTAAAPSVAAARPGGGQRDPTRQFRVIKERSQATRADGVSLDLLVIDHTRRRVSCYPPDSDPSAGRHLELPEDDRVVNVPLPYLFRSLATGELEKLRFQLAFCHDGPLLRNMIAVRGPRISRAGREVVEIRYGPDFGRAIAWLTSQLLPTFSFWFDARDGQYLGHRMPLHRKGPEILLVRKGLTPPDLGLALD